jgi:predicted nucleotidyltransferase
MNEMKSKTYQLGLPEKVKVLEILSAELNMRNDITFAYVYGSFAEEGDLPVHDIDIGVHVAGIGNADATPYALELGAALTKKTGMLMHVTVINHAPIPFLYQVISGKTVFSRDEEFRSRIVEQAICRYLDIKPMLRYGTREAFAA